MNTASITQHPICRWAQWRSYLWLGASVDHCASTTVDFSLETTQGTTFQG